MTTPLKDLVGRLYPFAYSVTGDGNDAAVPVYQAELAFELREFDSGRELNGWVISPAWSVAKAEIRKNGRLIYDGAASPLGVIAQSPSFNGRVNLEELKKHLFHSDENPDAIVYHWTRLYRPDDKTWGFCVPKRLFDRLEPGEYEVALDTRTKPATMKVLDAFLPGLSRKTLLFHAHNCHPYQANDDISGVAVGIELMRRLQGLPERRFSYRLVVSPELIGSVFWLDSLGDSAQDIAYSMMLKSVGNDAPLRLQESFTGDNVIDRAAHHVFRCRYGAYDSGPFRTIHGADETVFEAPPYSIPSVSLTRWPFAGYHTDQDTPDKLLEERLQDTLDAAFEICLTLERNVCLERRFDGLVSLSRYGLYKAAPGIERGDDSETVQRWNLLMNCLPRYLDGKTGLLDVAERYRLPLSEVHAYAMEWVEKGLARTVSPGPSGSAS